MSDSTGKDAPGGPVPPPVPRADKPTRRSTGKKLLDSVHVVHGIGNSIVHAIYAERIDALEDAIARGSSGVTEVAFGEDVQKAIEKGGK